MKSTPIRKDDEKKTRAPGSAGALYRDGDGMYVRK